MSQELLPLFLAPLIGLGSGLTSPNPYQEKRPFNGITPDALLAESHGALSDVLAALGKRASEDVSFPDAVVGDLPTFTGGGLPMAIGMPSLEDLGHGGLRTPYTAKGLDLDLSRFGGGGVAPPKPGAGRSTPAPEPGTSYPANPAAGGAPNPTGEEGGPPNGAGPQPPHKMATGPSRNSFLSGDSYAPAGSFLAGPDPSTADPTVAALSLLRSALV